MALGESGKQWGVSLWSDRWGWYGAMMSGITATVVGPAGSIPWDIAEATGKAEVIPLFGLSNANCG